MPKTNKPLVISISVFVMLFLVLVYVVYTYFQRVNFQKSEQQQLSSELQFANDAKEGAQNQPFLAELPIITKEYSIYYSSLNNEIDVIFPKNGQDIKFLQASFETPIFNQLENIGVDTKTQKIVWLLEK